MTRAARLFAWTGCAALACAAGVDGPGPDGQDGCCDTTECGAGLTCEACSCVPEECCATLDCEEQGLVCARCRCVEGDADDDQDGWNAADDCDDGDPETYPGADETCNGADDDCDGTEDDGSCEVGACCDGSCVRIFEDAGNCGDCGVSCDDDDPATLDSCLGGECRNDTCEPGEECCVPGGEIECCDDGDCDDGDACTADRCDAGVCAREPLCDGPCCEGECRECCGDDDCDDAEHCDEGECRCGPEGHYLVVDGRCLSSCGIALSDAKFEDSGGGCCDTPCATREAAATWDCVHCCEAPQGVAACR